LQQVVLGIVNKVDSLFWGVVVGIVLLGSVELLDTVIGLLFLSWTENGGQGSGDLECALSVER